MYRESDHDLSVLLQNKAASDMLIAWLKKNLQEARETHEAALHAALFDDSQMNRARITYGSCTAILDLLTDVQEAVNKIKGSA